MNITSQFVKRDMRPFTIAWLPVNGKPRRYKVNGGSLLFRNKLIFLLHKRDEMLAEFNQEAQA